MFIIRVVYFIHLEELVLKNTSQQNPRNWSRGKRCFVTFMICLLTFSIYIGSAIYSAGIMDVEMKFGVSQVAATLGLTLFVAGYGVGPVSFYRLVNSIPSTPTLRFQSSPYSCLFLVDVVVTNV
jgi:hypothetical protein